MSDKLKTVGLAPNQFRDDERGATVTILSRQITSDGFVIATCQLDYDTGEQDIHDYFLGRAADARG